MSDLLDEDIPYERQTDAATEPTSLGNLVDSIFDASGRGRLVNTRNAARAWNEANGDRERKHTTGVTLVPPRGQATDPRMVVYVDSNVLLSDFRTNTDLYLGRLANWGIALSGLDFRLSHDVDRHYHAEPAAAVDLPPLTPDQEAWLDDLVSGLPEAGALRTKVRAAAASSLRRG